MNISVRNNVKIFGNGSQVMLFAHGFGCDQHMWRYIIPAFENDYRIVLFDYVGSGKSDKLAYSKERYRDLNGYALDILEICAAFDLKKIIFIGHSVSSSIGLLAANQEAWRFSRLIMIGPSPRYINDPPDYVGGFERSDIEGLIGMMEKNYNGWANYLAPVIMQNATRPVLANELAESFCAIDPKIAHQFAEATFYADNRADLAAVSLPVLIMQCSEDIIAPLVVGDYIHRHIKGSIIKIMKASGHCPHLSHPDETIQMMSDYLATQHLF